MCVWFVSLLFCVQQFYHHKPLGRCVCVCVLVPFKHRKQRCLASVTFASLASSSYGCWTELRFYTISHSSSFYVTLLLESPLEIFRFILENIIFPLFHSGSRSNEKIIFIVYLVFFIIRFYIHAFNQTWVGNKTTFKSLLRFTVYN